MPAPYADLARKMKHPGLLPLNLRVDLRMLILALSLLTVLLTFGNTFYVNYTQQRALLIRNTLDANEAYARKMADMTDRLLQLSSSKLAYSAKTIGQNFDSAVYRSETQRLLQQDQTFNSVYILNSEGRILSISPQLPSVEGALASSEQAQSALKNQKPVVSDPYVTPLTDRLVIFISQPIFGPQKEYLGAIFGTVYLHEANSLHSTLGEHHYQNGVYLFVVDRTGHLLFHKDALRIGQNVSANPVVRDVINGRMGNQEATNTLGQAMLSGYAPITATGWGVVVQRPVDLTLDILTRQMSSTLLKILPLLLLTMLAAAFFAWIISHPLHTLAVITSTLDDESTSEKIRLVPSWYYEVIRLKQAILAGLGTIQRKISRLNHESVTDPLTGLMNRRGMNETLANWEQSRTAFAVIAIDLDNFKPINDTHGHNAGDEALRFLAAHMNASARTQDVLCRTGGDEFTMLLPNTTRADAAHVARRLAQTIAEQDALSNGYRITLSIGIADFRCGDKNASAANTLKAADIALYKAKEEGRNQIVLADQSSESI